MSDPNKPSDSQAPAEDWVESLYQQDNHQQPPEELDNQIRSYAADAVKKSKASALVAWRRNFAPAIASAAIIVLAVGIVLRGGDEVSSVSEQEISGPQALSNDSVESRVPETPPAPHAALQKTVPLRDIIQPNPSSSLKQKLSRSIASTDRLDETVHTAEAEKEVERKAEADTEDLEFSAIVSEERQQVANAAALDMPREKTPTAERPAEHTLGKLSRASAMITRPVYTIAPCVEETDCSQAISHSACADPYTLPVDAEEVEIAPESVLYNSGNRVYEVRCSGGSWLSQSHDILD